KMDKIVHDNWSCDLLNIVIIIVIMNIIIIIIHHEIFFSVILRNITVPAAILRNITQTYANSRNITQYYAILRKFTHVNSCKTYIFKSLRSDNANDELRNLRTTFGQVTSYNV